MERLGEMMRRCERAMEMNKAVQSMICLTVCALTSDNVKLELCDLMNVLDLMEELTREATKELVDAGNVASDLQMEVTAQPN